MAALAMGCTVFDGLQATVAEAGSSASGAGGTAATTTSATGSGGSGVGGGSGGGGGAGGAGGGASAECVNAAQKGPAMVAVKTTANDTVYCIDSTEVTRDQYQEFLGTSPEPNQLAPCDGNTSFTPEGIDWPPKPPAKSLPVSGVDYCDALAYCAWAGKRLCGAIKGGPTDINGAVDPTVSQWMNACSNGGALEFPYGPTYEPQSCNGADYGAGQPIKVQNASACLGGVAGLFDMSGNVREWEDACDGSDCSVRGGSFQSDNSAGSELSCGGGETLDRYATDPSTGFRCCSP